MADNPIRVNPIGQIADAVVEQVKDAGSNVAKTMATEPAKILEQILGGSPPGDVEQGNQTNTQSQAQQQADQKALMEKKQALDQKAASAYKLHQQRLQEEIEYYQKRKAEEAQKQQAETQQEEQKKEVVQLQKQKEEEEVWQQQIKAVQGSHEGQQGKF